MAKRRNGPKFASAEESGASAAIQPKHIAEQGAVDEIDDSLARPDIAFALRSIRSNRFRTSRIRKFTNNVSRFRDISERTC